jgi:hypothetical protein
MSYTIVSGKLVKHKGGHIQTQPWVSEVPKSSKPSIIIPDDIKEHIAATVRSYVLPFRSACWFRAIIGNFVLHTLGIEASVAIGSMVYRAGPDEWRDVMAYCGPGNIGHITSEGSFLGHAWLQTSTDIIDFSVSDWRNSEGLDDDDVEALITADRALRDANNNLGAIQWTAPQLPEYFWRPTDSFPKWRQWCDGDKATYTPRLGECWYGPMRAASRDEAYRRFRMISDELVADDLVVNLLKNNIEAFRLKERIAELKGTAA